jgi:hypothetical protein
MATNQRPVFAYNPKTPVVNISAANTSNAEVASPSDSTSFRELYVSPVTAGSKVTSIAFQFVGTGTVSAGIANIWLTNNAGANARVVRMVTIPLAAGAISNTVPGYYVEVAFQDFQLEDGQKIFVSVTTLAANTTLNVRASIGDFEL